LNNRSKEVLELIERCLTKKQKNRITVEEILESDWIKKNVEIDD
jgi:serine/threonine protein kinase